MKELEKDLLKKDVWENPKSAIKKQKSISLLEQEVKKIENLSNKIKEIREAYDEFWNDEDLISEIREGILVLKKEIKKEEIKLQFKGKYDKNDAIIEISSGAGGRDAEDFVAMLARMYERYAERKNYKRKIISTSYGEAGGPDGRNGIKNIILEIRGDYVFGLLKGDSGTHRLVRKSPFSSAGLRHTSFAQVDIFPKIDEDSREIIIRDEDIKVDTFKSSGPGGQHVNKRESAVRVTHIPTGITVSSQEGRLQGENKKIALDILKGKLQKIKEEKNEKKIKDSKGEGTGISWGTQIRNYILHPYKLVKDLRTKKETSNVEEVLDGNLELIKDDFF